ncbi:MAG: antibiotic biosynthesis monooxygenase [Terrimicrobiaceae bacterium]
MPTVIISQNVLPGKHEEFRQHQGAIGQLVKTQPGFVGMEVLEPVEGLQSEFVVIFRFLTDRELRNWLASGERQGLLKQLSKTLSEPPAMQILSDNERPTQAVSVVFTQRIRPGAESDFRRWREDLIHAQSTFPGYLGTECFPSIPGTQEEWVDIVRFASASELDAWLASPERKRLLERKAGLSEKLRERRVASGLEAWFSSPRMGTPPPPRWKQALAVLLALYPTASVIAFVLGPVINSWPLALRMLTTNVLGVAVLTWFAMPVLTCGLAFWLAPREKSSKADVLGTLLVVIALTVLCVSLLFLFGNHHL